MKSQGISAVVIVKNGEAYLEQVLTPLIGTCAEVLVLDSGSTDRTLEIARRLGVRIEAQEFLGYGRQKQRAVELAAHDWVVSVDADEVLDRRACQALRELDLSDPDVGYRLLRRNFIGADEVRFGSWSPDWCLRIFCRRATGFTSDMVHESVVKPKIVRDLPGSMVHYSYRDCADVFARMGGYARMKALRYRAEGRKAGLGILLGRAVGGFTKSLILKQGFRDGGIGVVVALSVAVDQVIGLALASREAPAPARGD